MLLAGFIVSPTGTIHSSVLAAFGEISTLVGAILGINYASRKKVDKIWEELHDHRRENNDERIIWEELYNHRRENNDEGIDR